MDDEAASTASTARNVLGLLGEQLAIGVLKNEGTPPNWLSLGVGAYFAAALDPRAADVRQLRKEAYGQYQQNWTSRANDVLGGQAGTDATRAVGYAIVDWMAHDSQARRFFSAFVRGMLDEGQAKLDNVIENVLNGRRQDLLAASGEWVATHYGRSR